MLTNLTNLPIRHASRIKRDPYFNSRRFTCQTSKLRDGQNQAWVNLLKDKSRLKEYLEKNTLGERMYENESSTGNDPVKYSETIG